MKIRAKTRKQPSIELTPLVDVVFLLLTFYMLTSTFIKPEGVPLDLPQSSSQVLPDQKIVSVSLVDEGTVQVDQAEIPLVDLQSHLRSRLTPETTILLRSGKDGQVQSLISVLDEIRAAGGSNVTLATRAKE